jgi:hypothetical protein
MVIKPIQADKPAKMEMKTRNLNSIPFSHIVTAKKIIIPPRRAPNFVPIRLNLGFIFATYLLKKKPVDTFS